MKKISMFLVLSLLASLLILPNVSAAEVIGYLNENFESYEADTDFTQTSSWEKEASGGITPETIIVEEAGRGKIAKITNPSTTGLGLKRASSTLSGLSKDSRVVYEFDVKIDRDTGSQDGIFSIGNLTSGNFTSFGNIIVKPGGLITVYGIEAPQLTFTYGAWHKIKVIMDTREKSATGFFSKLTVYYDNSFVATSNLYIDINLSYTIMYHRVSAGNVLYLDNAKMYDYFFTAGSTFTEDFEDYAVDTTVLNAKATQTETGKWLAYTNANVMNGTDGSGDTKGKIFNAQSASVSSLAGITANSTKFLNAVNDAAGTNMLKKTLTKPLSQNFEITYRVYTNVLSINLISLFSEKALLNNSNTNDILFKFGRTAGGAIKITDGAVPGSDKSDGTPVFNTISWQNVKIQGIIGSPNNPNNNTYQVWVNNKQITSATASSSNRFKMNANMIGNSITQIGFLIGTTSGGLMIDDLAATDAPDTDYPVCAVSSAINQANVTLTSDAGAKIYYTTDGTDPYPIPGSTTQLYTGAIPLERTDMTVKALAVKDSYHGDVITVDCPPEGFSFGIYQNGVKIASKVDLTAGADITAKYDDADLTQPKILILAVYEGNALLDFSFVELSELDKETEAISLPQSLTDVDVKAFLWSDFSTIQPLSSANTLE